MIYQALKGEANKLFTKYGLFGWKLNFDNAKRRFGLCNYRTKTITMSKDLVSINAEKNPKEVFDVLLHEVGHALSVHRHGVAGRGHGYLWKQCVIELGGKPTRCYDPTKVETVKGKYKYVCNNGHEHFFHKTIKRRYACAICCKEHNLKTFDAKFELKPAF